MQTSGSFNYDMMTGTRDFQGGRREAFTSTVCHRIQTSLKVCSSMVPMAAQCLSRSVAAWWLHGSLLNPLPTGPRMVTDVI